MSLRALAASSRRPRGLLCVVCGQVDLLVPGDVERRAVIEDHGVGGDAGLEGRRHLLGSVLPFGPVGDMYLHRMAG